MTIRFKNELLLISILVILLIIIITFFQSNVLQIILGLPFLLFFPGYTLMAALFPKRSDLDVIERMALSCGLSIAVAAVIGLILNYTMWGITLYPILISLTVFILTTSIIAWVRRWRLVGGDRLGISLSLSLRPWRGKNRIDKILSIILMVVILVTVGTIGYAIATPREEEKFTEFYILGLEGEAEGYPTQLSVGEIGWVTVGIVNHEHESVVYRVEAVIDGVKYNQVGPTMLEHDGKWEVNMGFTPDRPGNNQKVEFLLYRNEGNEAYRMVHLWLNVKEQE